MLHPSPHPYDSHEPVVELRGVTCGYEGVPVVERANLKIARGDFVGLLGPSGSGKTTILKTILGAADVYEGEVLVDGRPIKERPPNIGYVPQLETIDWEFPVTVEQVVMMGMIRRNRFFPRFRKEEKEHAYSIMERLGIADFGRRHIRQLSGGQQQRVFLARALVSNPTLLLLDEPTNGVDIKTRDEVMHLLDELNHQDITILLTTHEINAVGAHLPWVVCMNGRIVAEGPPSDVFTPEILKETYNAEIHITEYQGMKLVAESPHYFGRNGRHNHEHEAVGETDQRC